MKKFSFVIVLAIVLTSGSVVAQSSPPNGSAPCADEPTLGHPVLKRRQPTPEDQPTPDQSKREDSKSQPCNNSESSTTTSQPLPIRFEGLTVMPESDLRIYLRQHRINPSAVLFTNGASYAEAESAIKEFLNDYGYRHAQVSSRLDQHDNENILTFVISEGPRFDIADIRFEGNRMFRGHELVAKMKQCIERLQKGEPSTFRSDVFDYCLRIVTDFERAQGYLQARFSEPNIQEVGQALVVTIHSDEGILYRVGNLEIEGADHVPEAEIREMLGMRRGDIASGEKIARTMFEDLKATYGDKGFIQYTAEIEPTFRSEPGESEGVVDFKIIIDEGQRFRIRKISFKGDDLPGSDVRQLLLLRDGDVYSQKSFEESIRRINQTGWFNRVDMDKDVDYRTNEEEGLVDVVIKLTRRNEIS